jgi:hypothetical protein
MRWGLNVARLGPAQSGQGMAFDDALNLRLPDKEALLDYVGRCFALADRAIEAVDDGHWTVAFSSPYSAGPVTVGDTILAHVQHERYHLGQMRYLKRMMDRASRLS